MGSCVNADQSILFALRICLAQHGPLDDVVNKSHETTSVGSDVMNIESVLQQINAAAASPLLTLDVDETTNSIVMRAPPEVRQEIKAFVDTLDHSAGANRSRNVRVIRIQQGRSEQMRDVLEQFILESSQRN